MGQETLKKPEKRKDETSASSNRTNKTKWVYLFVQFSLQMLWFHKLGVGIGMNWGHVEREYDVSWMMLPSVLWRCWLDVRKNIRRPVINNIEWWRWWCGYQSGEKWMVYFSCIILSRLSWKRRCETSVCFVKLVDEMRRSCCCFAVLLVTSAVTAC